MQSHVTSYRLQAVSLHVASSSFLTAIVVLLYLYVLILFVLYMLLYVMYYMISYLCCMYVCIYVCMFNLGEHICRPALLCDPVFDKIDNK